MNREIVSKGNLHWSCEAHCPLIQQELEKLKALAWVGPVYGSYSELPEGTCPGPEYGLGIEYVRKNDKGTITYWPFGKKTRRTVNVYRCRLQAAECEIGE